jgi:hypothetical protein
MSADAWLHRIEELERVGSIDYEYGPEARRLITENGVEACASHGGAKAVIDTAIRFTTKRSLVALCLDQPTKVRATGKVDQRLVMAEARRRVGMATDKRSDLQRSAEPIRSSSVSTQPRTREIRSRRTSSSSRSSPDDPDLPRRCEYCGRPLNGKRPHAKTCSDSCRVLLHRRRRRQALAAGAVDRVPGGAR